MRSYIKRLKEVFKKGNSIDKFNIINYAVFFCFSIVGIFFYCKGYLKSIRFGISDTIAVSSIILGILGVFIGILIGQRENSKFFKATQRNDLGKNFFVKLMAKIRNQFFYNIVFIVFTLLCDFLPVGINSVLKIFFLVIWFWLFMVILWGVFYIVSVIVDISINDTNMNDRDEPKRN